jgi:hypothetical protein
MNLHSHVDHFATGPEAAKKTGLLRRLFTFLLELLSGPKGDQGGWEGGARGL